MLEFPLILRISHVTVRNQTFTKSESFSVIGMLCGNRISNPIPDTLVVRLTVNENISCFVIKAESDSNVCKIGIDFDFVNVCFVRLCPRSSILFPNRFGL